MFSGAIRKYQYQGNYRYCYCTKSSHLEFMLTEGEAIGGYEGILHCLILAPQYIGLIETEKGRLAISSLPQNRTVSQCCGC